MKPIHFFPVWIVVSTVVDRFPKGWVHSGGISRRSRNAALSRPRVCVRGLEAGYGSDGARTTSWVFYDVSLHVPTRATPLSCLLRTIRFKPSNAEWGEFGGT